MAWIELDDLVRNKFKIEPLAIEEGGTGSTNIFQARQNLIFAGTDLTDPNEGDSVNFWKSLGNCIVYYTEEKLLGQKGANGFLENRVSGNNVNQTWYEQNSLNFGCVYRRAGRSDSGWYIPNQEDPTSMWIRVNGHESLEDYVIENGETAISLTEKTSLFWFWKKWASGKMDLYGYTAQQVQPATKWSENIYYDGVKKGGFAYPVPFVDYPVFNIHVTEDDGNIFATTITNSHEIDKTNLPCFYACSFKPYDTSVTIYEYFQVKGRWK